MKANDQSLMEIIVRPVHPDDAIDLYQIVSHPAVARTLRQLPSMEFAQTQSWLSRRVAGRHRFVAELEGKVVGSATITHYLRPRLTHSASVGVMVHPEHWRQGIGSALVVALVDLADNWLNLRRVELDVFADNEAAVRLYQKFGFEIEGRRRKAIFGDGRWHDEYLMARLRDREKSSVLKENADLQAKRSAALISVDELPVRPIHPDDAAELQSLSRHRAVARATLQMPSLEYAQALERVESQRPGLHRLVAIYRNRVVGSIHLSQLQNPRESHIGRMGMMVHPDFWGCGIGSHLVQAVLDLADNWLNLKRIELEVNTDNPVAVHLYEKFGFTIEGTKRMHTYGDGRWADSHFMARIREPASGP